MRRLASLMACACMWMCACDGDDAPPSDAMTTGNPDTLLRACAIYSSCISGFWSLDECVEIAGPVVTAAQLDCVVAATATDCTAVNACFGQRNFGPDPACVAGCADADTIVRCSGGFRVEIDCAAFVEQVGPVCVMGATRTDCGGGTCAVNGALSCDGTIATRCDSGVTEVTDCARWGMECDAGDCVGAASGSCTAGTPATCDGANVVECDAGVRRVHDCSRRIPGMTCVTPATGATCGYDTACDSSLIDTCNGAVLDACVGGARHTIDCTTIGATACMGSASDDAYCRR